MRTPAEISTAGAVGEPGAIARTIIYSVLISAGVVLLNIGWGRPEVAITQLLTLLLANACGVVLMRLLAAKNRKPWPRYGRACCFLPSDCCWCYLAAMIG